MVTIRGAICIAENKQEDILSNTKILLENMIESNQIELDQIISITFSATKDITAAYPAPAAREIGIFHAGLMCLQEMYVENSLPMCIRILMFVNKPCCQNEIKHLYLNGAEILRPDLLK